MAPKVLIWNDEFKVFEMASRISTGSPPLAPECPMDSLGGSLLVIRESTDGGIELITTDQCSIFNEH